MATDQENTELVTESELASKLGVAVRTLQRWRRIGKVSYYDTKPVRYNEAEVMVELKRNKAKTGTKE